MNKTPLEILTELKTPWFCYQAVDFLDKFLRPHYSVFEWGSGASTIWFANRVKRIVSIEHNKEWFDAVNSLAPKNVELRLIEMGNPPWKDYAESILDYKPFHVIIIDGIYISEFPQNRHLCTQLAIQQIRKLGFIILDNSDTNKESAQRLEETCSHKMSFFGKGYGGEWETSLYFYE